MTQAPAVLTTIAEGVMVVTINRPEARNACNLAVWLGIGGALEQAKDDPAVRAIVLTGAGDLSFCAGADIRALARGEAVIPDDPVQAAWGFAGIVSHPIGKPVIAAVNGAALGGGLEIALSTDIIVAVDGAMFGLPEVTRGMIAGAGGAMRLPRHVPRKVAMEMLLTGRPIDARQARAYGLVNHVVPRSELMTRALEIATRIAANAPLAVQATKRIALGIVGGDVRSEREDWPHNDEETRAIMASDDVREGTTAFAERRPPVWSGR